MYQSSSLTFFYKYLFPLLWGGGMLVSFSAAESGEDMAGIIIFTAVMSWLIVVAVRLKSATANSSHITLHSFDGDKRIGYKDIEYIYESVMINPRMITLKYTEERTGESDIIYIMPSTTSEMFRFKFLKEHDMTQYIREQIVIHNPGYSAQGEPSRWKTPLLLISAFTGAVVLAIGISTLFE